MIRMLVRLGDGLELSRPDGYFDYLNNRWPEYLVVILDKGTGRLWRRNPNSKLSFVGDSSRKGKTTEFI
jgi:hypothetical protein